MFKWAMGEVMVEANPVVGTNNPTKNVARERVLTDAELRRLWQCCSNDTFGRIVKLLILTAARRLEVGGMTCGMSWNSGRCGLFLSTAPKTAVSLSCRCRRWLGTLLIRWEASSRSKVRIEFPVVAAATVLLTML
jgi:integrase